MNKYAVMNQTASQAVPSATKYKTGVVSGLVPSLSLWRKELAGFVSGLLKMPVFITLFLLAIATISAVGAVYSVHMNRQLFSELQTLQAQQDTEERR